MGKLEALSYARQYVEASPMGAIYLDCFDIAQSVASGSMAPEAIALSVYQGLVDVGGSLSSAVPVFGQVIETVVSGAIAIANGYEAPPPKCEDYLSRYPMPLGSGSSAGGCKLCPADIFAPIYPISKGGGSEAKDPLAPGMTCSAFGQALAYAFETPARCGLSAGKVHARYNLFAASNGEAPIGPIPSRLSTAARLLRLEIGRQHNVSGKLVNGVDGGVSLWPAYLDTITEAWSEGYVTAEFLSWYFGHNLVGPDTDEFSCWALGNCNPTGQIGALIADWVRTNSPNYPAGAVALAEASSEVQRIKQRLALKAMFKPAVKLKFGLPLKPRF